MLYSRLISSLIDESIAALLGGYNVTDAIGHIQDNGDPVRRALINVVSEPRFQSTVRAEKSWEQAAQKRLEELAAMLLQTENLNQEELQTLLEQFLSRFFLEMLRSKRKVRRLPGPDAKRVSGGEGDGSIHDALEEMKTGSADEEDEDEGNEDKNDDSDILGGDGKGGGTNNSRDEERQIELKFLRSIPPSLRKLARLIGRTSQSAESEGRFLTASKSDIAGITVGNDLSCILPSEIALLAGPGTQDIFLRKFAEKRLQVFASASSGSQHPVSHQDGPVIICLDTSSSMMGYPSQISAALTLAVSIYAQRRHRKVLIVKYADGHIIYRLTNLRRQRPELLVFLSSVCNGGNDENAMFSWLFGTILPREKAFTTADVLCVSDFGWMPVNRDTMNTINEYKKRGMIFYGLNTSTLKIDHSFFLELGEEGAGPGEIIDSMWQWTNGKCIEV